jgi:glycine cleavage system H lipoate-binding protein/Fe-S oxidoreductase/FAD/FMN-containing dehydrogenase
MKIERYTYPDDLYYDRHHAYARVGDEVVVQGITDLGQGLVGEVFFVELPYVGRRVKQGDLLLSIQPMAVRARACRVYATVSGEVVAVNAALEMAPESVNDDPYGMGWIVKIRPDDVLELQGELDSLQRACDPTLKTWARRELAAARLHRPDAVPASVRLKAEEYDFPVRHYFDRSHAYARVKDGLVTEGVTDLGQALLGEVLFVELPYVGRKVEQGDRLFSVQPMRARGRVRHMCAAVSGEIVAVNESLEEHPDWVNRDAYGRGWVARIRPTARLGSELSQLLTASDPKLLAWVGKELEMAGLRRPSIRREPVEQPIRVPVPRPVLVAPLRLGDIPLVNGRKTPQPETPKVAGYEFPLDLRYDLSHAYARLEGDVVIEGITDLAQGILGEIFFVELPPVGRRVRQGDRLLSIQSMGRARPIRRIRAVVSGEIVAVNEAMSETPEIVNQSPYREGWLVKIRPTGELKAELADLRSGDDPALATWAWEEFERDAPPLEFLARYLTDRVTSDEMERQVYSRDLAPVPELLVKPLGIQTRPELIARPIDAEEIAVVMKHARRHYIPITPRASASTVYFDAVPYRSGILLDLSNLRGEPTLDEARGTVRVVSAIRWAELDDWLRDRGWAVLAYPTSAPSATVGGWFSTEGYGIGSLTFGCVHEQVVSAQVVLPDGTIIDVDNDSDPPLAWFAGTGGTMGVVTAFELRVRRAPEAESHHAVAFPSLAALREAAVALAQSHPRPYNMHYSDVGFHHLVAQAGFPSLGDCPVLTVDFEGSDEAVYQGIRNLLTIVERAGGGELPEEVAHREWEERFRALRAKRSGPTLLAAKVWLPLDQMDGFIHAVERLGRRMGVEFYNYGSVVAPDAAVAFAMYRSDETKVIEYVMSLSITKRLHDIGKRHGGHPYGVGLWNTPYLRDIFTREQIAEMRYRKAMQDPRNILNPGKLYRTLPLLPPIVFRVGLSALSVLAALRGRLRRPFTRPALATPPRQEERPVRSHVGVLTPQPVQVKPIYTGMSNEALICGQCGYCRSVCPVFDVLGWETTAPRGKIAVAKNLHLGNGGANDIPDEYIQRLYQCTLCGSCKEVCPTGIDTRQLWLDLREMVGKTGMASDTFERLSQCIANECNITCEGGETRTLWTQRLDVVPEGLIGMQGAEWLYFPGCVASLFPMVNSIPRAFVQTLARAGLSFTTLGNDECCCGFPLIAAGMKEQARQAVMLNVTRAQGLGVQKIVTTCPSCYHTWKHVYPELIDGNLPFEVWHATELLAELVKAGAFPLRHADEPVTYHDPCDLGRTSGIFDEPRAILAGIEGLQLVEMARNREDAVCCGGGGNLEMVDSDLVAQIGLHKMGLIGDTGVKTVISACQQCKRTMTGAARATKTRVRVKDITEVVWEAIQAADEHYGLVA